jgi:hypothetical protein
MTATDADRFHLQRKVVLATGVKQGRDLRLRRFDGPTIDLRLDINALETAAGPIRLNRRRNGH